MPNYKRISERIEELKIDNPRNVTPGIRWINITNAGKNEINYLRKNYIFDLGHLRSVAASMISQRPLILRGPKYLFLILHFPGMKDGRVFSGEIDFFIGHGFLVSAHNNNLPVMRNFFDTSKKDPNALISFSQESSAVLLYEILGRLIRDCYRLLDENSLEIKHVEEMIFSGQHSRVAQNILNLRSNIINVRKIMQNHKNIFKELSDMKSSLVDQAAIKKYYNDLTDNSKRLWEMLDNQKEMVEAIYETNESLVNTRMNSIMKTLTVFSVIVFPLNLLAAVFGMNTIFMPLVDHPYGFWLIVGMMLVGMTFMIGVFKYKRWI